MKKLISVLLILAMLAAMIPAAFVATSAEPATATPTGNWTDEGNYDISWAATFISEEANANTVTVDGKNYQVLGLSKQTIEIKTAAELAGLTVLTEKVADNKLGFENVTFVLTNDIDLADHYWIPIGDVVGDGNVIHFSGSIVGSKDKADGTGTPISIKNMTVDLTSDEKYHKVGLVGGLYKGTVKNLDFTNASLKAAAGAIATAVGLTWGRGVTVENITSDAKIEMTKGSTSNHDMLGGIVGKAQEHAVTIRGCVFTGTLTGSTNCEKAGGILGATNGGDGHLIQNCVVASDLISAGSAPATDWSSGVGGIVGVAANLFTVENCYANAYVALPEGSTNERVGGIVGSSWSGGTLKNVQFDGIVTASGKRYRGAFIGAIGNADKTVNLENCLNTGISAGFDLGKLQYDLISNMFAATTTINATNVYSTSEILMMAGKTDKVTCKSFDELAGDGAKTALSGFDFDSVWTTRTNRLPILSIAENYANSDASIADFSWFKPENGVEMEITNERQVIALKLLVKACGNQLSNLLSTQNIKIANVLVPMLDDLSSDMKTALLAKTVAKTDAAQVVNVYAQTSKAVTEGSNCYAVRFVAEINGNQWAGAGFDLLVRYTTADGVKMTSKLTEQTVSVCYKSISAGDDSVTAPDGHYFIVFVLDQVPVSNGNMTFTVSAYANGADGAVYGNAGVVTFDANGSVVAD